tara:strand:+ start:207 stop:851 length:645 start_codon:yes stop_codon:yes gene_type:complete
MRTEFNTLVETLKRWDLYQLGDEVDMDLKSLEDKITELEKRMECVTRCNKEIDEVVFSFVDAFEDRGETEQTLTYGQFEVMLRGIHDIDIAMDLKETECIDNNWYGLFEEPKEEIEDKFKPRSVAEYVATLPKEEPPTYQSSEPETFDKVKQVIETLKTLHNGDCVDGETMQYILEQVGMDEQMHRQLVMKNDYSATKDLMREKFETDLLNSDI